MEVSAALERELQGLGLDGPSAATLALLPLVQVAWADGEVQETERTLLLERAKALDLPPDGMLVLGNWLAFAPTEAYLARGHAALGTLSREAGLPEVAPDEIVASCRTVARAAGGLFGVGATSRAEADAIAQVAEALGVAPERARPAAPVVPPAAPSAPPPKRVAVFFHTVEPEGVRTQGALLGDAGQRCPIDAAGAVVGRGPDSDVQVANDGTVSRAHCRLHVRDDRHYVTDLQSKSGTFVDGERVLERRLFGGEQIRVGSVSFRFDCA